jgi:hypothetical protein
MPRPMNLFVKVIIYAVFVFCLFVLKYGALRGQSLQQYKQYFYTSFSNTYWRKTNKEWTVMLSVNNGYLDFFLNWLSAYRFIGLTYPIIVIAEDHNVFVNLDKYKANEMRIIESELPHINDSVIFGSTKFNELSVRRHKYILKELQKGSNIIFSDTDTVWLKSPIPYFTGDFNIWMQLDKKGYYCPGFLAVKSSDTTISFFKNLTQGLTLKPQPDQPFINEIIPKSNIRVAALPVYQFPSGREYFRQFSHENRTKTVIVHNNWIKGYKAKRDRFLKFNLWFLSRKNFGLGRKHF